MYFVRPFILFILLAVYLLDVALTFVLPHQINYAAHWSLLEPGLALALACICCRMIARTVEANRPFLGTGFLTVAVALEGIALFILTLLSLRTMDYLSKGTSVPLADAWLARAELMLGFSWRGYFDLIRGMPQLHWLMMSAYEFLNSAIALVLLAFALTGRHERVKTLVEAAILCAVGSLVGGALFPAIGAAAHWVPDYANPATWAGYPRMPGVYFVEQIERVRRLDAPMLIGGEQLTGLVSMPSLHTALAVVMIVVARRTWIFWPALAYGTVMIAATPIWGGHYLPDVIAGAAMAIGAVALVERFPPAVRRDRPDALVPASA